MYVKHATSHACISISRLIKNPALPYLLFVNGGPGMSSAVIETLITQHYLFEQLNYNIICYDQRNTGRSLTGRENITHQDNIEDLKYIIDFILLEQSIDLQGIIAHSYGAKLAVDAYKKYQLSIPAIFLSMADSILTPRINNLMLDLAYLKKTNESLYSEVYLELNDAPTEKIWKLTEKLAPIFQNNTERLFFYWANLEKMKLVQDIQSQLKFCANQDVFMSVRKELYSDAKNYAVDIPALSAPYLWINGFHDFIMSSDYSSDVEKIIFMRSSHYPHIEENSKFCELTNEFISTNKISNK